MASSSTPTNFERSISLNDLDTALEVRELIEKDLVISENATSARFLRNTPWSNFLLPKVSDFVVDYRKFIASYLVDTQIYKDLESTKRLNWCSSVHSLVPILTMGDGNCLMHAASLGMWAVNDRYHTLRKTVYEALLEDSEGFYYRRWRREHEVIKSRLHGDFEMTEVQWQAEWDLVMKLVSQIEFPNGPQGAQYGSLEEIHIFVLANVLRRTVIVISDETLKGNYGEPLAPINFGGVYLPLQWDPVDCVKTPLVIGYCQGHFTAIVSLEDGKLDLGANSADIDHVSSAIHAIPLVKHDESSLPIHFLFSDEEKQAGGLLRQYLDCVKLLSRNVGRETTILAAKLLFTEPPECVKKLTGRYFAQARTTYEHMLNHRSLEASNQSLPQYLSAGPQALTPLVPCHTKGCDFFGSQETANYCSNCFKKYLESLSSEPVTMVQNMQPTNTRLFQQQLIHSSQQQMPATEGRSQQLYQQGTVQQSSTGARPKLVKSTDQQKSQLPNCATENCKYYAAMELGGLCVRCFEAERIAKEMASSGNSKSVPCANKVNGCQYFGQPDKHNLCSHCFVKFQTQMEKQAALRQQPQPSATPSSSAPMSPTPKLCLSPGCPNNGVLALYNRCVYCYASCIKAFISSDGKSVAVTPSPAPLPSSAGTKGNLCATPGCLEERIPQLNNLCFECYETKVVRPNKSVTPANTSASFTIPQSTAVVTNSFETSTVQSPKSPTYSQSFAQASQNMPQGYNTLVQGTPPLSPVKPASSQSFSALPTNTTSVATVPPQSPTLTATLLNALGTGIIYCSNHDCMNPIGGSTGYLCPNCSGKSAAAATTAQTLVPQTTPRVTATQNICKIHGCNELTSPKTKDFCLTHFLVVQEGNQHQNSPQAVVTAQGSGTSVSRQSMSSVANISVEPPQSTKATMVNPLTTQSSAGICHSSQNPQTTTIAPSSPPAIRCPTPGCTFYGAAENNFLCSRCYNRNMAEWRWLISPAPVPQQSQPVTTSMVQAANIKACAIAGCQNKEAPQCNGLCNHCYESAITQELRQWAGEPQTQTSRHRAENANESQSASRAARGAPAKVALFPCLGKGCLLYISEEQGYCESCRHKLQNTPGELQRQFAALQASEQANRAVGMQQRIQTHAPMQVTPSQAPNVQPPVKGKCRQYGCRMYGSDEFDGYCSKCFMENLCGQYSNSVPDQTQGGEALISPRVTVNECINAGCKNPPHPQMHNHCSTCFRRLYPELTQQQVLLQK